MLFSWILHGKSVPVLLQQKPARWSAFKTTNRLEAKICKDMQRYFFEFWTKKGLEDDVGCRDFLICHNSFQGDCFT